MKLNLVILWCQSRTPYSRENFKKLSEENLNKLSPNRIFLYLKWFKNGDDTSVFRKMCEKRLFLIQSGIWKKLKLLWDLKNHNFQEINFNYNYWYTVFWTRYCSVTNFNIYKKRNTLGKNICQFNSLWQT